MSKKNPVAAVLSHPISLIIGIAIGVYLGVYQPQLSRDFDPVGDVYIDLLKMVVLPFLVSAITVSISKLLNQSNSGSYIRTTLLTFIALMVVSGVVGVMVASWMSPGSSSKINMGALGELVQTSHGAYPADLEISLSAPPATAQKSIAAEVVRRIVPDNIFSALSAGDSLRVLVFCLTFGVALGVIPKGRSAATTAVLDSLFVASQTLMRWINLLLPFAIMAMVASQVSKTGLGPLTALVGFIEAQAAGCVVLLVIGLAVLWFRARTSLGTILGALREPVLLAATTRSSVSCIPSSVSGLIDRLRFDPVGVELVLPLGITICRFGPILYYAIGTVFVGEIYGIDFGPGQLAFVVLGSMLAGLASAGTSGALTITMLALVCGPLGLPVDAAIVLFIAVDPVLDVFRTVLIVFGNCVATAVICPLRAEAVTPPQVVVAGAAE